MCHVRVRRNKPKPLVSWNHTGVTQKSSSQQSTRYPHIYCITDILHIRNIFVYIAYIASQCSVHESGRGWYFIWNDLCISLVSDMEGVVVGVVRSPEVIADRVEHLSVCLVQLVFEVMFVSDEILLKSEKWIHQNHCYRLSNNSVFPSLVSTPLLSLPLSSVYPCSFLVEQLIWDHSPHKSLLFF